MWTSPMFPLGGVLLPGTLLPLHVFEPRYRAMTGDVLAGDGTFGVVLIERGSEVGGGDVRSDVGTLARIARAEQFDDGRWMLLAEGAERIRVRRWLPDDPYPMAELEAWPDDPDAGMAVPLSELADRLATVLALASELGHEVPDFELAEDAAVASYQAAAAAPLGPLDRQRVLTTTVVADRVEQVLALLADLEELLRFRLGRP